MGWVAWVVSGTKKKGGGQMPGSNWVHTKMFGHVAHAHAHTRTDSVASWGGAGHENNDQGLFLGHP